MRMINSWDRLIALFPAMFTLQYTLADVDLYEPGIVVDDEQMLLWMQDASYAISSGHDEDGLMNWHNATAWIEGLDFGGYGDWRLPLMLEVNEWANSTSEISYLYTEYNISGKRYNDPTDYSGPFINIPGKPGYYDDASFWTGTEYAPNPSEQAWVYSMLSIGAYTNIYDPDADKESAEAHVWPVKTWTWGPYTVVDGGWVDTGDWLGWLWVREATWIYCWDLQQWLMIERDSRDASEGWLWIFQ